MQKILAIETSCDETAAAIIGTDDTIFSNIVASQIETHKDFGGVIPEIASRMHVEVINLVIEKALAKAEVTMPELAAIAVTEGPGLLGALLIGIQTGKTLSYIYQKPLIAINHMEGHIMANFLKTKPPHNLPPEERGQSSAGLEITFPFLCLVVSGGHTQIVISKAAGHYETIGRTIDDAAGEAYDKVARLLQLGYPGGPIIDKLAKIGDENKISFGQAKIKAAGSEFDFSFSGLKTAVINYYRKHPETAKEDICASFQKSVIDTLTEKTFAAAKQYQIKTLYLAGGVSANSALRQSVENIGNKNGIKTGYPPIALCTDNAAMIGAAAVLKLQKQEFASLNLRAIPNLKL